MGLQSIIGRAGSGKTYTCVEQIRQKLIADSTGSPIIYLVPEQMTFQAEYTLATTPGLQGMIRAQVYSFTRIAWKVLQETGGLSRQHIDSVGIHMLLRKLLEQHKQELRLYARAADQTGFIDNIERLIVECKRYCIGAKDLKVLYQQIEEKSGSSEQTILDKLQDLHLILSAVEAELSDKYIAAEDYLRLLANKIPVSNYIRQAEIWIDGFYSYTPQELLVIEAILKYARNVKITHTLDKPYNQELPHELHLFHNTAKTYQRVQGLAQAQGIEIEEPIVLADSLKFSSTCLAHLEANYHRRPVRVYNGETAISIASAVNRRAEVEGLARAILSKVRDQGYRYRDLAIILRNTDDYQELIETTFAAYKIPLFFDQKKPMLHHPLIELIRSSLDVVNHNWRYEAVFRCAKTDLMTAARESLDQLENYVLAQGIYGERWKTAEDWRYTSRGSIETGFEASADDVHKEREINYWRRIIATPLIQLESDLQKASTGRQYTEVLYNYLVNLHVPETITEWQQTAEAEGELEVSRQHQQAWQAVIKLFDQLVEIIGETELSLELFSKMVDSGLESMKFSQVPPAFDQVVVANIDHSRLQGIRSSFFLGVNDGVVPAKLKESGVFTEDDRGFIQGAGLEIAPTFTTQLLEEPFTIYNALASASDSLWVSYPLADEEGKTLLPAALIGQLKEMFPNAQTPFILADPQEELEEKQLDYIASPDVTISYLTSQLRYWKRGYQVADLWWDTYNWYANQSANNSVSQGLSGQWQRVIDSLFYKNQEPNLRKQTSEKLYGKDIKTSVSRLEKHRGCPFAQYASYGLQLKERESYKLENPDIGQLYHGSLKLIADILTTQGKHWGEVTEAEYTELAKQAVGQIAPRVQNKVLLSSKRYQYILKRLTEVLTRTTIVLGKQAQASGFTPIGLEIGFDVGEKIPALQLQLADGRTISLRGRIDRVDQALIGDELFLRVIDYKSSQVALDLSELADGISLQMLTYLDVVLTFAEQWLGQQAAPAGVLYFHVHNPIIKTQEAITIEQLDQEHLKKYRLRGLILAEKTIAAAMDAALLGEGSRKSDIIPATIKVNGDFGSRSNVASRQQFELLRNHVRSIIRELGTEIVDGTIAIKPYRIKQKTPCRYCSYRPVCQFDQGLEENEFRRVRVIKDVEHLTASIGGEGDESRSLD
ncbi:helicase-exonuclease AddAB subunit AddB [Desulfuribacillus alkaliarsenatis]|uniref:ATP-dependent helicase/deoxyribonuclease subunit B n=1 Tax=Desulfuribacillus alkaliarsenatis TaxID=766136 RepID=A0A1E5G1B3_9FIRM|nr:helicase-exonuclease AddAB subunit AddB [Desulfuribacillus alkaliarsenatis]OEF96704.1 helicase-exonuclease AddAB subunit AddB [Desulfuribacillus alkaliarsenatis]